MKIIIPMAGLGSRFSNAGYEKHKPLIEVNGKTLVRWAVETLGIKGKYIFVCRDLGNGYLDSLRSELDACCDDWEIKTIERVTTGAAETALLGLEGEEEYTGELIVTNCDQYLCWNADAFLATARNYDGAVLTYSSSDPKNSFCEVINGQVIQMVEKVAISSDALVGVHYWKNAQDFKRSTKASLADFSKRTFAKETYVSETYNYLLEEGKKIGAIDIYPGRYWSTGTPEDLAHFKGMMAEFLVPKNDTYFIDLDGTIFLHSHRYSELKNDVQLCDGVREALDELDSRGDKIILVSARKESARALTEKILEEKMIPYDQLILGVSQGCRIVVNDVLSKQSKDRARGVNVITDRGWKVKDL